VLEERFSGGSGLISDVFCGKSLAWWSGVFAGVFKDFGVIRGGGLW
jgi:hypothetical protein